MTTHDAKTKKILFWVWLISLLPILIYLSGAAAYINDTFGTNWFSQSVDNNILGQGAINLYELFQNNLLDRLFETNKTILLPTSGEIVNQSIVNILSGIDYLFYNENIFSSTLFTTESISVSDLIILIFFKIIPSIIVLYMLLLLIFAKDVFFDTLGNFSSWKAFFYESIVMKFIFFFGYLSFFVGPNEGGIVLVDVEQAKKQQNGDFFTKTINNETKEVKLVFKLSKNIDNSKDQDNIEPYKVPNIIYYLFKFVTQVVFSLDGDIIKEENKMGSTYSQEDYYPIFPDYWNSWVFDNYIENNIDILKNPIEVSNNFILGLLLENYEEEIETIKLQCFIKRKTLIENKVFLEQPYENIKQEKDSIITDINGELTGQKSEYVINYKEEYLKNIKKEFCEKNLGPGKFYNFSSTERYPYIFNYRTRNYICKNNLNIQKYLENMKEIEEEILKYQIKEFRKPLEEQKQQSDEFNTKHYTKLTKTDIEGVSTNITMTNIYSDRFPKIFRITNTTNDGLDGYNINEFLSVDTSDNNVYFSKTKMGVIDNILNELQKEGNVKDNLINDISLLERILLDSDESFSNINTNKSKILPNYQVILNKYFSNNLSENIANQWFYINQKMNMEEGLEVNGFKENFKLWSNNLFDSSFFNVENDYEKKCNSEEIIPTIDCLSIPYIYFNLAFGIPKDTTTVTQIANNFNIFSSETNDYLNRYINNNDDILDAPNNINDINKELDTRVSGQSANNQKKKLNNIQVIQYMLQGAQVKSSIDIKNKIINSVSYNTPLTTVFEIEKGNGNGEEIKLNDIIYIDSKSNEDEINPKKQSYINLFRNLKGNDKLTIEKDVCGNNKNIESSYKGLYTQGPLWSNELAVNGVKIELDKNLELEKNFCIEYNKTADSIPKVLYHFQKAYKNSIDELKSNLESYNFIGNYLSPYLDLLLYLEMFKDTKEKTSKIELNKSIEEISKSNIPHITPIKTNNNTQVKFAILGLIGTDQNNYTTIDNDIILRGSNVFFHPKDDTGKYINMTLEPKVYEKEKVKKLIDNTKVNKNENLKSSYIDLLSNYITFIDSNVINNNEIKLKTFEDINNYITLINKLRVYLFDTQTDYIKKLQELNLIKKSKSTISVGKTTIEKEIINIAKKKNKLDKIISLVLAKYHDFYVKYKNYTQVSTLVEKDIMKNIEYKHNYFALLNNNISDSSINSFIKSIVNNTHYKITRYNTSIKYNNSFIENEGLYNIVLENGIEKINTGKIFEEIRNIKETTETEEEFVTKQVDSFTNNILPKIKDRILEKNPNDNAGITNLLSEKIVWLKENFENFIEKEEVKTPIKEEIYEKLGTDNIWDNSKTSIILNFISNSVPNLIQELFETLIEMTSNEIVTRAIEEYSLLISFKLNKLFSFLENMIKDFFILEKEEKEEEEKEIITSEYPNDLDIPLKNSLNILGIKDIFEEDLDNQLIELDNAIMSLKTRKPLTILEFLENKNKSLEACALNEVIYNEDSTKRDLISHFTQQIIIFGILTILEKGLDVVSDIDTLPTIQVSAYILSKVIYAVKYIIIWQTLLVIGFILLLLLFILKTFLEMVKFIFNYILKPLFLMFKTIINIFKKLLLDYVIEIFILVYKLILSLANPEHIGNEIKNINNDILNISKFLQFIGTSTLNIIISLLILIFAIFIYYMFATIIGISLSGYMFEFIITQKIFVAYYMLPFIIVGSYYLVFKLMNYIYKFLGSYIGKRRGE